MRKLSLFSKLNLSPKQFSDVLKAKPIQITHSLLKPLYDQDIELKIMEK